ncbi:Uncharacterised protein [Vibrio cholerae]|nr:Uncharacterised protein [Vibrio cholerae]
MVEISLITRTITPDTGSRKSTKQLLAIQRE